MVTLLTDYTKQRRTLNSLDDVSNIEWHNGDEVLLMDQDIVLIFSEGNSNWYPVPTGGGGGGTPVTELKLLASGEYVSAINGNQSFTVSYTGIVAAMVVYNSTPVANTQQGIGCGRTVSSRMADYPSTAPDGFASGCGAHALYAVNAANNPVYVYNSSVATTVALDGTLTVRGLSAYPLKAGTYKWYLWGFEA